MRVSPDAIGAICANIQYLNVRTLESLLHTLIALSGIGGVKRAYEDHYFAALR